MAEVSLVMPMAGRGSRFLRGGEPMPKPLIELEGHPFFWWAAESVARGEAITERVFVVLEEHIEAHAIDRRILGYYPDARIVALPDVTSGAAETAAIGIDALRGGGAVAVNDCDHAFAFASARGAMSEALARGCLGGLVGFASDSPAYSYIRFDADDAERVVGTVEKVVASPFAIAGCYFFQSPDAFREAYQGYREACPYDELFVSGLFNRMIEQGGDVAFERLATHLSFGTPEELDALDRGRLHALWSA